MATKDTANSLIMKKDFLALDTKTGLSILEKFLKEYSTKLSERFKGDRDLVKTMVQGYQKESDTLLALLKDSVLSEEERGKIYDRVNELADKIDDAVEKQLIREDKAQENVDAQTDKALNILGKAVDATLCVGAVVCTVKVVDWLFKMIKDAKK